MHQSCAVVLGAQTTTAQLHPGQDAFEFDQGDVTRESEPITVLVLLHPGQDAFEFDQGDVTGESEPITVLVFLSESLGI